MGVYHTDFTYHDILWNHISLPGDRNRTNIQEKEKISSREFKFGETISRKTGCNNLNTSNNDRKLKGIVNISPERQLVEHFWVILKYESFWYPAHGGRKNFPRIFYRGRKHPRKWVQHSDGKEYNK
jgi:hypothetical protein